MSVNEIARRGVLAIGVATAIAIGTTGCGTSTTPTAAAPTSTSAATSTATAAPATTAATTSDAAPAGADASTGGLRIDPGDGAVDGPQVAQGVSAGLAKVVGRAPERVTCPDLPAKVGTKIRCTLTDSGETYGVTVTTTSVQGNTVNFGITVDEQPS